jgi:hypothetical protein
MSRRPHVLLVGMQFPPARGSGVYRIRAWAIHLARQGADVTVLAGADDYWHVMAGDLDEQLRATVDPRVRVVQVRVPYQHLLRDVKQMTWFKACFPALHERRVERQRRRVFPEVYAPLVPRFVRAGLRVGLRRKVDVVVATGNPYAQVWAARRISRLLRVPFVADFHDPWTLDLWQEAPAFAVDGPEKRAERAMVEDADLALTVNRPLLEWYQQEYPTARDRVRLVENGFADDVVGEVSFAPAVDRPLRFVFIGTIRGDLPLEEFLAGWELALEDPVMQGAQMEFWGYLGFFRARAEGIRARVEGGTPGVSYRGPVSQTELHHLLSRADVMAMLLTSSRFVTAGKGYDYMASGRTVLGVHDPRNDTTGAFADYPAFVGVEAVTPEGVRDGILRAAHLARAHTQAGFEACRAEAMRHTWDRAMGPVAQEILALAGR